MKPNISQLDMLARMGMGGATVHVRTGLSEPAYLSEDFLNLVRDCSEPRAGAGGPGRHLFGR